MHLLRISRLFYLTAILLTLASCAMVGGRESHSDMDAGGSDAAKDPLQGGLWNDSLWADAPEPYVNGLKAAKGGRSSAAMKYFRKSIYDFPEFAPAYTNMGLQQIKLNDLTAAEKSLKKAIEIEPNDAVAYNHLGVIARMNGKFDAALKHYKKAISLKPKYANAHLNLGILLDLYLYDLKPALKHYESYQSMISKQDATVSKWIVEIKRRIKKGKK